MDNANYSPALVPLVVQSGALDSEPLVLFDIGCGMGIDPLWRRFGRHLHGVGFDPNIEEVERLRAVEDNPNFHYQAALVGLPESHEFLRLRQQDQTSSAGYFVPWERTSTSWALERQWNTGNRSLAEANAWSQHGLSTEKVSVDDFARSADIRAIDFIKIDTDGNDLEVLLSAEETLAERQVLGLLVESNFTGTHHATSNSHHNIDRLMRAQGFQLYSLSVNRYSRAALPAPFEHRGYAQTLWGQALWGDALYLRDAGAPEYQEVWGTPLTLGQTLKLASLYELFCLPDCAAELLDSRREMLDSTLDVDRALDLLTPPIAGRATTWREYVDAFKDDPSRFFPPENALPTQEAVPGPQRAKGRRTLRAATAAWAGTPEPVRRRLRPLVRGVAHRLRT